MTKSQAKPAIAAVNDLFSTSPDGLREIVRAVMQEMLEAEMTDTLGAEKGERTAARLGYRSGYYTRTLVTRVGKLELRVPQDRDGQFSTELFERYQRSEQALVAPLSSTGSPPVTTLMRRSINALRDQYEASAKPHDAAYSSRAPSVERQRPRPCRPLGPEREDGVQMAQADHDGGRAHGSRRRRRARC